MVLARAVLALCLSSSGFSAEFYAGPLFNAEAWKKSKPPGPEVLEIIVALGSFEIKGLKEMAPGPALALVSSAARRGFSAIDIFTDKGLRGKQAYYLSRETLRKVEDAYELGSLCPISGRALNGEEFSMKALIMGQGQVVAVYDKDFSFKHPVHRHYGGKFRFQHIVSYRIEGPGRVAVKGAVGPWRMAIRRLYKVFGGKIRVETLLRDVTVDVVPIKKRESVL